MTKKVRIENADTSNFKVKVQVWQKGSNGNADVLLRTVNLDYPCLQVEEHIHSHQYLVIKEPDPALAPAEATA